MFESLEDGIWILGQSIDRPLKAKLEGENIMEDREELPLDCDCGCKETEMTDIYYQDHYMCEYQLRCKQCGKRLGIWAYGTWNY